MARLKEIEQAIYVMEAPTGESKIGIAEDAYMRWGTLNGAYPRGDLKLLWVSERRFDAWRIEEEIHEMLDDKRLNGEWFDIPSARAIEIVSARIPGNLWERKPKKARTKGTGRRSPPEFRERSMKILEARKSGMKLRSIALKFGITQQRVSQILAKCAPQPVRCRNVRLRAAGKSPSQMQFAY